jgi:hypothetical protein
VNAAQVVDWYDTNLRTPQVDLEASRQLGRRIIRAGDVVKISRIGRGCVRVGGEIRSGFRVIGFRGNEVVVVGARSPGRVEHVRTFTVDRIGARPRTG